MEKKQGKERERIETVLKILKKQVPLTMKQEKYCNDACVERFLKAKGDNAKKAAKQLRAALCWRESVGTDRLIADEFSEELAGGFAYVAGHDDEARPVVVFRIKQEYPKTHSQKLFVRLLVFTLEVAISSMSRFVDQFVVLFDATGFFRSASAFLSFLMGTLKIIYDYYPCRLHKAFVIDAPSLFSYLWKGVRPFVELSAVTVAVSSLDFDESLEDAVFGSYPTRTASLRFDRAAAGATASARVGVSKSSRFSFTVSHLDSLKPWYLSTSTATPRAAPNASPSIVGASPLNARSFSFASPAARSAPRFAWSPAPRSIPSTPCKFPPPKQQRKPPPPPPPPPQQQQQQLRTPRPSFLQSPAALFSFRKEAHAAQSREERERESFLPYLGFHRRPYDEMVYRAKMRPPLGGLISIISPHLRQRQQQQMRRNAINIHHHQHLKMQTLNY
ncbi:SEC14 cytosolic factor-like isoform X1 [Zingiber officinale]|uniref:SEC14 cytosolic factor-like isoform X1 n=1 Tax=Zingiber officinale TaxID=94328 RepID=UPI001C4A956A|nr:SEC14 cytosolic factor-like isoform X1 [Zingiber officinale]